MANDITAVSDILIAEAGMVLREMATTARRVTTEWNDEAAQPNAKIAIPIASSKTVQAITDARAPLTAQDVKPRTVDVVLDKWKGVSFFLSDREQMEMKPGIFPKEAEEALRAIVNQVDTDILLTALQTPYAVFANGGGVPGTKVGWPEVTFLYQMLFDNKCPIVGGDLSCFINGTMQAELHQLAEFMRYDATGETGALRSASLGRRLEIDFFANQNLPSHTVGGAVTGWTLDGTVASEGYSTTPSTGIWPTRKTTQRLSMNGTVNMPKVGDIITIAGAKGTYTVVGGATDDGVDPAITTPPTLVTIRPSITLSAAATPLANSAVIAYAPAVGSATQPLATKTYAMGYAFHRSAIAFASRPLSTLEAPGSIIRSTADPLSGISVRLEVIRVGKTNEWQWDILYGTKLVREEMAARWIRQQTA